MSKFVQILKGLKYSKCAKFVVKMIPDKFYLQIKYKIYTGKKLNLGNPQTYNEKLQWLKLYDHRPEYKTMVDKNSVKDYVASKLGPEYIIPTLGVWDRPEDIEWNKLPNQFVLKTTTGGGSLGVVICRDKNSFDKMSAITKLKKSNIIDIYIFSREWPYKDILRKIIAEQYMEDAKSKELYDYKIMTFGGKAKLCELHLGRFTNYHTQTFYSLPEWEKTGITQGGYSSVDDKPFPKPECLSEIIRCSEILAKDTSHLRVDWYIINGKPYFGELTFFDGSGFEPFDRIEDEFLLGSWIDLSTVR